MRLFSTPKTSPELVRHSLVEAAEAKHESMPHCTSGTNLSTSENNKDHHSPNSPGIVRGVSTLGRKFSRRFEKIGDSEAARKLRMASPSRKYHFTGGQIGLPSRSESSQKINTDNSTGSSHSNGDKKGNNVSRVDSFRNFFLSTASTTLKTPRAVKRRSRNTEKHRSNNTASCNSKLLVDASTTTSTGESRHCDGHNNSSKRSSLKSFHRSRFGSELTLPDANEDFALSECQSEADLRGYATMTEDEDDRSVVSDFQHRRNRSSSGNLAARLGILPENRTILDFKEPGNVFSTTNGLQIKTYGLIDDVIKPEEKSGGGNNSIIRNPNSVESGSGSGSIRKSSNTGQESGYGSDGATTNSSRASPRGSLEGAEGVPNGSSVRDKIMAFQTRTETPSPPTMTKDAIRVNKPVNPPLLMPKPNKSAGGGSSTNIAPKKPARLKLSSNNSASGNPKNEMVENPSSSAKQSSKVVSSVSSSDQTPSNNNAQQTSMIDVAIAD